MLALLLGLDALLVLALAITLRRAAAAGRPLRPDERPLTRAEMRPFVRNGLVYVNPDDPRGWVPKVSGYGWTVNLRTPEAGRRFVFLLAFALVDTLIIVAYSLATGSHHH
jgi:uncharacterized membrane protein